MMVLFIMLFYLAVLIIVIIFISVIVTVVIIGIIIVLVAVIVIIGTIVFVVIIATTITTTIFMIIIVIIIIILVIRETIITITIFVLNTAETNRSSNSNSNSNRKPEDPEASGFESSLRPEVCQQGIRLRESFGAKFPDAKTISREREFVMQDRIIIIISSLSLSYRDVHFSLIIIAKLVTILFLRKKGAILILLVQIVLQKYDGT